MPWSAIISAFVGALPSLVNGLSAFSAKHAELRSLALTTHQQTIADDDAELARRKLHEAPTAPVRKSSSAVPDSLSGTGRDS